MQLSLSEVARQPSAAVFKRSTLIFCVEFFRAVNILSTSVLLMFLDGCLVVIRYFHTKQQGITSRFR